jgi:hypothetical protein
VSDEDFTNLCIDVETCLQTYAMLACGCNARKRAVSEREE